MSVRDFSVSDLLVANGSTLNLQRNGNIHPIFGRMEIRIGHSQEGRGVAYTAMSIPKDMGNLSTESQLELATNHTFWGCIEDLQIRFTNARGNKNPREKYSYFVKANPVIFISEKENLEIDLEKWEETFKELQKKIRPPFVNNLSFNLSAMQDDRYIVNTEGSKVFSSSSIYTLTFGATAVDDRNLEIPHGLVIDRSSMSKMPSVGELEEKCNIVIRELEEIVSAPIQHNGAYPAIIDSENVGVLFHEVMGYSFEGHRMQEEDDEDPETYLFNGKIGEQITPSFLNVYDDPTISEFNGVQLGGHYLYDDDCVLAQRVDLVKNGIL